MSTSSCVLGSHATLGVSGPPKRSRLALAACLLIAALCVTHGAMAQQSEASAQPAQPDPWAPDDVASAQSQCRANITATGIEGPKVDRYCSCVTESLQARFSAAEVREMQREHDPGDNESSRPPKLESALNQCSAVLESP